jgi:hypothetical protein
MLARNPASLLSLVAWLKTKDPESCGITAVPLSLSAPSPFHGAGRLLTRPLEGPVEAYARLGNGSMALRRAVCTGDTINRCDTRLTSAMGRCC